MLDSPFFDKVTDSFTGEFYEIKNTYFVEQQRRAASEH